MPDLLERLTQALTGRYAVESEIGRGGMATVFLAEDLKHHRRVAVKVLHPELASTVGAERFLREIEIAAGLDHPHILTLLDSSQADGLLYYVMPYVEGESLRDRLGREGQLPIEDAIRIAREVADGVGYAHRHAVIHRDIKPANIMLADGHALIADFGVARAVGGEGQALTSTGLAVGTPAYMSPEQASGERVDARSDLYALGCVLYEMLAGAPPLTGPTPQATAAMRLTETATPLPVIRDTVPGGLERVVGRLLAKSPADRYATAEELVEDLDRPSLWVEPKVERQLWKWVGSAAVALALLAFGIYATQWFADRGSNNGLAIVPQRVAVLPFENRTSDPNLDGVGEAASERITTRLQQEEVGEVVPGTAVSAAVIAGGDAASAVVAATGASHVITGSITESGGGLAFEIRIRDGGRGTQAGSFRLGVESRDDVEAGLRELTSRLAGGLAFAFGTDYRPWALAAYPTIEAIRLYREGADLAEAGKLLDAVAHYRAAWEQDTTFWFALYSTVGAYYGSGRIAEADSLNRFLGERYRPEMSGTQRDFYDGTRAWFERDLDTAIRMQRRVVARLPDSPGDWWLLAVYLNRANRPRDVLEAIQEGEPYISDDPVNRREWLAYTATAHHMLGDFESEIRTVQEIDRLGMGSPLDQEYIRARALAGLGRAEEVYEAQDRMEAFSDSTARAGQVMLGVGLELRAHGYTEEAARAVQRSVRWFEDRPARLESDGNSRKAYGTALYHAGRWEDSDRVLESVEAESGPDITLIGYRGLLAVRRGDEAQAARFAGELERIGLEDFNLRGRSLAYRARLAALMDEQIQAVSLLKQAFVHALDFDYRPQWGPSRQYRFDFEGMADYAPYQELLRPKG